jgi:hypothetical protein
LPKLPSSRTAWNLCQDLQTSIPYLAKVALLEPGALNIYFLSCPPQVLSETGVRIFGPLFLILPMMAYPRTVWSQSRDLWNSFPYLAKVALSQDCLKAESVSWELPSLPHQSCPPTGLFEVWAMIFVYLFLTFPKLPSPTTVWSLSRDIGNPLPYLVKVALPQVLLKPESGSWELPSWPCQSCPLPELSEA